MSRHETAIIHCTARNKFYFNMKKFSIIFVISLTFVLGESSINSKAYDIFGFFVNETCATKYPINKENILRGDYKISGQQAACAVACTLQKKNWILNNGTIVGEPRPDFSSLSKEDHERCMKEEGICNKAACLLISIHYRDYEDDPDWSTCISKYYPDVLMDNNILKFDACDAACLWESRGWFTDGKPSADEKIASLNMDKSLSDLFKIMKASYETCKTVNGTCERAFCTREDYTLRLIP